MTVHNIYFDRQSVADGPDMPGRLRVELKDLNQLPGDVKMTVEHSSNSHWGRLGHWHEVSCTTEGLRQAAIALVEFHQMVARKLGLPEVLDFAYDYAENVQGEQTFVCRVIVSSPLPSCMVTKEMDVSDFIWRVRFAMYEKGTDPAKAKLFRESDTAYDALRFAVMQLLKAKVLHLRALRLPDTCNWSDVAKAIESRASKRSRSSK